ncbi:MAG: hypothetical protein JW745_09105 [Sedimentisphaerales bacterium]|nr:hypothetical protein [Sedimentisphaerales bacterium]
MKHIFEVSLICFITVFLSYSSIADIQSVPAFQSAIPGVLSISKVSGGFAKAEQKADPADILVKDWFDIPVTQKGGMFNPVFLPFEFITDAEHKGDLDLLTFPCLLSFKFDFVPDNYSARHPGSIYRKTRKNPIWFTSMNETQRVVNYIKYWSATHAIGGTIIQQKEGLTGEMVVIDSTGREVIRQKYSQPVPYFTFMGQMVKTWMEYRGQPVSDGLYQELIRPMTTDMECVKMYGKTFFVPWRKQEEWDIYEEILKRDPDFAEIRYWYANQKGWTLDSESQEYAQLKIETGRALQSHLVMPALGEFNYTGCPDKAVINDCKKVLDYAIDICGENPLVMAVKLKNNRGKLSIKQLDAMLPLAEKYPSNLIFLTTLASEYLKKGCHDRSMPLILSAIGSGYLKGSGKFVWEWSILTRDYCRLGYNDEAIYCAQQAVHDIGTKGEQYLYWNMAMAYMDRQDYLEAARAFRIANERKQGYGADLMSRLCIYQSGKLELLADPEYVAVQETQYSNETAWKELTNKRYDQALNTMAPMVNSPLVNPDSSLYVAEAEKFHAEVYILTGQLEMAKKHAYRAWYIHPQSRRVACLLAQCCKDDKYQMGVYLKMASFFYPDDQLWKKLAQKYEILPINEAYADIVQKYNKIKVELAGLSEDAQWAFWQQFSPFEIEYMCLALVRGGDSTIKGDVLEMYDRYRKAVSRISYFQRDASWLFRKQLQKS